MSTTISEEILSSVSERNSKDRYKQHLLAASGLSASIASQLIPTITTASPIAGVAHIFLSAACIMGLTTFIFQASPLCNSSMHSSTVLGYLSLWFAAIGIVVFAWAMQPEPVAIAVTVVFAVIVLAMGALSGCLSARKPNPEQNV